MGAEALLKEVEERRKKAIEDLLREYDTKVSQVRSESFSKQESVMREAKVQAEAQALRERTKVLGAAKLEGKRIVFDAIEKMLEENLSALKEALSEYAKSEQYKSLLAEMLKSATKRLGEGTRVRCRPQDRELLESLDADVVSSDLSGLGGFVAQNKAGTVELDLRFEELLRNHEDEVRAALLGKE